MAWLPEGNWQLYARSAEMSVVPAPEAPAAMPTVPASTPATSTSAPASTVLRERGGDPAAGRLAVLPTRTSPPFATGRARGPGGEQARSTRRTGRIALAMDVPCRAIRRDPMGLGLSR